ncbi:MAG: TolC family protein, partial [Gemmataceae bacterium]|nr:TolC family protein [Gemmataceae bacterium]
QWDRLLQAEELLQQQQRAVEAAVQQGLRPASDRIALHRQMQELRTRQSQLHSARIVLNASLVERLALGQAEPPLWPQTELRLDLREVDAEAAVATAWLYRPDLNVLRLLNQFQHRDREQVQGVIQAIHPLLGIESPRPTLLSRVKLVRLLPNPPEEHWHEQLRALVHSRQQQVASEVRAAIAVRQARRATAVAQQAEVDSWRQQVAELEKRQAVGQAVTAELLTARLELLRAEAALIQAVADWHLADVQLRQSLGLLVRE